MPFVSRILKHLGEKDCANPQLNAAALARALPGLMEETSASFLRTFLPDPEREARYRGRWDYPSSWKCVKERAYLALPDEFPQVPRDRRSLLVADFGNLLESRMRALFLAAGGKVVGSQVGVDTCLGHGYLDLVIALNEDGAADNELRLLDKGYRTLPVEVKSMTPFGFNDFLNDAAPLDDIFGYRTQQSVCLAAYAQQPLDNPTNAAGPFGSLLPVMVYVGVNKTNCAPAERLFPIDWGLVEQRAAEHAIVKAETHPNDITRPFISKLVYVGRGKERKLVGNALDVPCSYCAFRYHCWGRLRKQESTSPWGAKVQYFIEAEAGLPVELAIEEPEESKFVASVGWE